MKKVTAIILALFVSVIGLGQDIVGEWNGVLKVQGLQLRLVLHIVKTDAGYRSTMDSPDQGAKGMPVSSTSFDGLVLKFGVESAKIEYEGKLTDGKISGTFKQMGQSLPLDFSKGAAAAVLRPQVPVKPYPYYSEDVSFENTKDKITLAGTLTLPAKEGVFPVVVLISGSGPQNRDGEIMRHKPFLVLADHLTRKGIGVLRYDDRGTFGSKGNFGTATSNDFASDVEAAVKYLQSRKDVKKQAIGLVGHSEGGLIAPMVAAGNKEIAFVVLLAGPGLSGDQILLNQQVLIGRAYGVSEEALNKSKAANKTAYDIVIKSSNPQTLNSDLSKYLKEASKLDPSSAPAANQNEDELIKPELMQLTSPWMVNFIKYNPVPTLTKVSCPVLALNGGKDLQVSPVENLDAIKAALTKGGNKDVTTKVLPGLNHLFQTTSTGTPSEYGTIEETFSPVAMDEITQWILKKL